MVMLRNVLIYFSDENKKNILEGIKKVLKPEGLLYLGTGEPPALYTNLFEKCNHPNLEVFQAKKTL